MHDTFFAIVFGIILDFCWVNRILRFWRGEASGWIVCAYLLFIILLVMMYYALLLVLLRKKVIRIHN